jgi:hypothetical protein
MANGQGVSAASRSGNREAKGLLVSQEPGRVFSVALGASGEPKENVVGSEIE